MTSVGSTLEVGRGVLAGTGRRTLGGAPGAELGDPASFEPPKVGIKREDVGTTVGVHDTCGARSSVGAPLSVGELVSTELSDGFSVGASVATPSGNSNHTAGGSLGLAEGFSGGGVWASIVGNPGGVVNS